MIRTCFIILAAAVCPLALTEEPRFFRITPQRPVRELLRESLRQEPPARLSEGLAQPKLVSLGALDARIRLDIRYATERNFLGEPVYDRARAYLEGGAAAALVKVLDALFSQGYGLLIHDAYRPWRVTWVFWEATPPDKRDFVANPSEGSRHNRGCAVDLTLYDRRTGNPVEMPSLYDEMSDRAAANYTGGTEQQRHLRDLLRREMESQGFRVFPLEWWHFDYQGWEKKAVRNDSFEALDRATGAAR